MWPTARASEQENWTTPQAHDVRKRGSGQTSGATNSNAGNRCLATDAETWATPRVSTGEYTRDRGVKGAERPTLEGQAAQWQTPVADDMVDRAKGKWNSRGEPKLSGQAAIWPTPAAAQDTKGAQASAEAAMDREARGKQLALADRALMFTRPALPTWDGGLTYSAWRPISRRLFRLAMSSVPPTTLRRWLRGGNWRKRRLNPLFVSALMAWPSGHALCACSATAFTLWRQDMRGVLSALPTASGPWIWLPSTTVAAPEQMSLI